MLKKVTLGLIALGVSASALAAGPGADVPIPAAPASINVTAPVQHGSWEIGLEALYVEVGNANFQYAQRFEGGDEFKNYDVEPAHDWMGHADFTFNIPGNGRFAQLGVSYFSHNDSDTKKANAALTSGGLVEAPFELADIAFLNNSFADFGPYDIARGKSENDYMDVDLVFGQKIDVGHRLRLKFWGGVRYASTNNDDKGTYKNHDANGNLEDIDTGKIKSDFYGFGPRAGVDSQVNLGYGFAIVGRIAGSLLVGSVNQKLEINQTQYNTSTGAITGTDSAELRDTSDTRIIPEADARIGLHYNYGFNPSTSLGLEVGYQVVNYFGMVDKDLIDMVIPNTVNNNNDFGFHGPYLRAQINLA